MKNFSTLIASLCLFGAGTVAANAQALAEGIGIYIGYESVNEIEDDDEAAAAKWFVANYPDGVVVTPSTLSKIDGLATLWIPIDRTGIEVGYSNLPSAYNSTEAIEAFTKHVKGGGSLYLSTHATQLIVPIGRVNEKYAPNIFGSGNGGENADIWGINAQLGCNPDLSYHYDQSNHVIYAGLVKNETLYTDHSFFPLIGNGWKEDHNCMWDFNASVMGLKDDPTKIADFEYYTNSRVIGTWQHVTDYACFGVIEFKPADDFKGTVLCNGIAAYEFNQNDVTNEYQSNVELLTKNSLTYLTNVSSKEASAGVDTLVEDSEEDNVYYTVSGIRLSEKPTVPGLYIVNHKKVIIK